LIVTF